jgi:hypothetical protein
MANIASSRVRKWLLSVGIVFIGTVFVLPYFYPGNVSRAELTRSRMAFDRIRILDYAHEHGRLPTELSTLPPLALKPEADHYLEDAWHRKLIYEVDSSGIVTLKSFGKDGVPGGTDEDADILVKFPSRHSDGSWSQPSDNY